MTLRHLEIFAAVCDQGSFTRRIDIRIMAQPAVSLAIRELEVFYNVRLFQRMNRRVYLTEAGSTLRQYADTVLSQMRESVEVLRESGAGGTCAFGVHVTLGETRLAELLARLAREVPEVRVRAWVNNSRETERMILDNRLDFAVVDNVTLSPQYLVEPLCGEDLAAVCAPEYLPGRESLTLAELAEERLLLRERGSGTRNSVDAEFQRLGASPRAGSGEHQHRQPAVLRPGGAGHHTAAPVSGGGRSGRRRPPGAGGGGRRLPADLLPGAPPEQVPDRRHGAGDRRPAGLPPGPAGGRGVKNRRSTERLLRTGTGTGRMGTGDGYGQGKDRGADRGGPEGEEHDPAGTGGGPPRVGPGSQ